MSAVWREGQERMLDVFRRTSLSSLADKPARIDAVTVNLPTSTVSAGTS
jgi:hypothetical protein